MGEAEEVGINQMRLYPQSGLMVTHDKGLSDKELGPEIKGGGGEETKTNTADGLNRD